MMFYAPEHAESKYSSHISVPVYKLRRRFFDSTDGTDELAARFQKSQVPVKSKKMKNKRKKEKSL